MSPRPTAVFFLAVMAPSCTERFPRDALTAGWAVQYDEQGAEQVLARFVEHADAIEVEPGPNANLWNAANSASGTFRLSVDVTHLDSGMHPHGAGITFGGSRDAAGTESYGYMLVRDDRNFLIKVRDGDTTSDVVPWTKHEAVAAPDANGSMRNVLAVEAGKENVRFLINGAEVHRALRSQVPVDGFHGMRLVHDLHVRFGKPRLEALP